MAEDEQNMSGQSIEQPLVSVVMPAYNAARTITDAIDSVLQGTFKNFEIVICDDASRDDTAAIVEAFDDPRIRLIRNSVNAGEGAARNRAIDSSKGRWIALLDADDMYTPERLETLVNAASTHPGCIIFDEVMECHDTPRGMRPWRVLRPSHAFPGPPNDVRPVRVADWLLQKQTIMQPIIPALLIRKYDIRYSNKRCCADLEYILTLIGRSSADLWYVPRPMYFYRINPGSMSTLQDRNSLNESVLTAAIPLFKGNTMAVDALRTAADMVQKKEKYRVFFSAALRFDVALSAKQAWNHPWVIPEFVGRSVKQIPYHLSRLRHRGAWRKRA